MGAVERLLRTLLALPAEASEYARSVDRLQYVEFAGFWVLGAVTLLSAAYFAARWFRRGDEDPPETTPEIRAPLWLELGLGGFLLAGFVASWVVGFGQYVDARNAPPDTYEIRVTAKQWVFKFHYPGGRTTAGVVYLPAGRAVRFHLTSRDVIHSLFIPDFRAKMDAVPGRWNTLVIGPAQPGRHQILCAELCGAGHSRMEARAVILAPDDFQRWLETGEAPDVEGDLVGLGQRVALERGCTRCHTADGTPDLGPSWQGLFGRDEVMEGGDTVRVGPAYLTESMMTPSARIVAGFPDSMPSFEGRLTSGEAAALVEYIRSLQETGVVRPLQEAETGGSDGPGGSGG